MPGIIVDGQPKARKPTKNEQRRAKKKQLKQEVSNSKSSLKTRTDSIAKASAESNTEASQTETAEPHVEVHAENTSTRTTSSAPQSQILQVVESDDGLSNNPLYQQFAGVFAKFRENDEAEQPLNDKLGPEVYYNDNDNIQDEDEERAIKRRLSKKARKAANKLSIAELKALVRKPEVVEWTDISAEDPKLLVSIKSARNIVPVPAHWSLKREYLSSKRGIEKASFALPKFIAETGISEMRDAVLEKQAEATLKQRQRERVQGKMGKLDIDYQKLYEAFFRRQTKPELTQYGEVYYEGKEFETNLRHLRPGEYSEELMEALNMPSGGPPPWLMNQQKLGPPPSYPALKIPGVNAPLPLGGKWGFHPGGHGKPPINEQQQPLWGGDVLGLSGDLQSNQTTENAWPVDRAIWGELQPFQEEEEEAEDEDEDEEDDDDAEAGEERVDEYKASGPSQPYGTETPSGIASTVTTMFGAQAAAEELNLRKIRRGTETEESHHPRSAGQVLQERSIRAEGFFGGERAYDLGTTRNRGPVLGEQSDGARKRKAGDLDVSVDVDAMERDDGLSKQELRRQYESQREQENAGGWRGAVDQEDLSQMIAEESAKRQKRDQERARQRATNITMSRSARDRDRDRDRMGRPPPPLDFPPEDQFRLGRGQSYRPGGARERSPIPRADSYRARSPPRGPDPYRAIPHGRSPLHRRDTYRQRSPSPRFRERDPRGPDTYRGRPRSPPPPRRDELPKNDLFRRDFGRDGPDDRAYRNEGNQRDWGYGGPRSPPRFGGRSPGMLKRGREPSPAGSRGRRSPPPMKRERMGSPSSRRLYGDSPVSRPHSPPPRGYPMDARDRNATNDYPKTTRSPLPAGERLEARRTEDWRQTRQRSPPRPIRPDQQREGSNGYGSGATSRRSSPPVHPSRMAFQTQPEDHANKPVPYQDAPRSRPRSPEAPHITTPSQGANSQRPKEPPQPSSNISTNERETSHGQSRVEESTPVRKQPPTGPALHRTPSIVEPPTGPSASFSNPSSATRTPTAPPSGPRGGPTAARGDYGALRGRGSFRGDYGGRGAYNGSARGARGGAMAGPGMGRGGYGPPGPSLERETETKVKPAPRLLPINYGPLPAYRPSANMTTTSMPRSQRFTPSGQALPEPTLTRGGVRRRSTETTGNVDSRRASVPHPALADLPKIIEGGEKAPPVIDHTKLDRLEEEAEKLRRVIEEKEVKRRRNMREWDRLSRETAAAAFRTELAEEALRNTSGETQGAAAF